MAPSVKDPSVGVKPIDLDECEPIDIQARIIEIKPDQGNLVVAEREVKDIDVKHGDRRIKTSYLNLEGRPDSRNSFRLGQYVRVKGALHPDGYICAYKVQKIDKPVEKNMKYKPIEAGRKPFRKTSAQRNSP